MGISPVISDMQPYEAVWNSAAPLPNTLCTAKPIPSLWAMAATRQPPDSSPQPEFYTESLRGRLSISFTDCKALWIRYHFSGRRIGRFKAGVGVGRFELPAFFLLLLRERFTSMR
jgi:hypothetical protein